MRHNSTRTMNRHGFTMIEMMIVVTIIGILASIAVPLFKNHQLRARSSEAKSNLSALRVVEESNFATTGAYLAAAAEPVLIPGPTPSDFDFEGTDFDAIGWSPEGKVYFSYAVEISADASGYTADAGADVDADGIIQIWGYTKAAADGDLVNGGIGCDPNALVAEVVGSCLTDQTIY